MIVIVTDSTAYLTRTEAVTMGVMMVPMSYSIGASASYFESYVDDGDDYEQLIEKNQDNMHTSQVTLSAFTNAFTELRRAGHEVLCITISSHLSGTYANALIAAREIGGSSIEVVDSLNTCGGLYLLIREARRLLDSGLGLAQTAERLRERRRAVTTIFSVDDLSALRRSGRLGSVKMSISTILNIKPLLKIDDGSIVSAGIARGHNEQMKRLLQMIVKPEGKLVVEHFLDERAAITAMNNLDALGYGTELRKVGPVLGIHLGSGCIGIAWLESEESK